MAQSDLQTFVRYRSDPEVARYQGWETPYSQEQGLRLIESQVNVDLPAKGDWLQLAIHRAESGDHIGDLALHQLDEDTPAYEIGFTVAKEHQGRGYAGEAAKRLLTLLFDELGALSVSANTDKRNDPSIRLLRSLGFLELPEKNWFEEFKNEQVEVLHFEISKQRFEAIR